MKHKKENHVNWKLARRIALGVLCLFFIIIAKAGGVFIDLFVLLFYGMGLLGIWAWRHIYLGGLDRIAQKNAKAMLDEQEKRSK